MTGIVAGTIPSNRFTPYSKWRGWYDESQQREYFVVRRPTLPTNPDQFADPSVEKSHDPNAIVGPAAYGSQNFVNGTAILPYAIDFQNSASATASAAQITITQQLDSNLNWGTFQLGDVELGSLDVAIPAGVSSIDETLDERSALGVYVHVVAGVDANTGVATWTLTALDPTTMRIPSDPTLGLLPPDTSPPAGDGSVSYTIQPKSSAATATVINAQASIVFDTNGAISTPQISDTLDVGRPTSTIQKLPAWSPANFTVSWSGQDDTGGSGIAGYTVYYSVDGGAYSPLASNTQATSIPFAGTEGHVYYFTVISTDNVGNAQVKASPVVSTTVDATPPTTTAGLSGTAGTNGWYTSSVQVTLSATDATSGVASTEYQVDGGTLQNYSGSSFTVSGDGMHTVTFYSIDNAGNQEANETATFKIDGTKPVTTAGLSGTAGANGWYTGSVQVTLSATDATSGVASTEYQVDGGTLQNYSGSSFTVSGDGMHTVTFYSIDNAGNQEANETATFKIDGTKPVTTAGLSGTAGANGWYTGSVQVTLSATDATSGVASTEYQVDGGTLQNYSGSSFTVSGDGMHTVTFYSIDNAGNQEANETATFKIDGTKPVTTAGLSGTAGTNGWYTSSVQVTLSATDATSGVASTEYQVDGGTLQNYSGSSFTVSGNGIHTVTFYSIDNAGNQEANETATFKINGTKPVTTTGLSGTAGTNGWYTSSVQVTLSATDATSGVASTEYQVDGGTLQNYSGSSFTVSGNGMHTVTFYSIDNAGNQEANETATFKINTTAPTSTVATLPTVEHATSFTVSWSGLDVANGSGVASYDVYVIDNGGTPTLWQSAATATSAIFAGAQDAHTYGFYSIATDNAGNVQAAPSKPQATTQFFYVSAAVAPLAAYEKTKSFTVSWSGSTTAASASIANYTVWVSDDGAPFKALATKPKKTSMQFTGRDGHMYTFCCTVTDSAGHVLPASAATRVSTLVDLTAPTCHVSLPTYEDTSSFTISWSGSDGKNGSGIATYTVYVSDNGGRFKALATDTAVTSATFTGAQDGHTYRFYAVATDRAGNVSKRSPEVGTLVDLTPPTSMVAPLPKQEKMATFTVYWSGSDRAHSSGVASYTVYVSDNGGVFKPWVTGTTKTSTKFIGQAGHTYAFYSVATDNAGNVQPTPSQDQATTTAAPAASAATASIASTNADAVDAVLRALLLEESAGTGKSRPLFES